jgi:hypothetical protein
MNIYFPSDRLITNRLDSKIIIVCVIMLLLGSAVGYAINRSQTIVQISTQNERISILEMKNTESDAALSALQLKITTYEASINALNTKVAENEAEAKAISAEKTAISIQLSVAQTQLQTLEENYNSLNVKYQAIINGIIGSGDNTTTISRNFSWSYNSKIWSLELLIPKVTYNYFKNHERPNTEDYSIYITNTKDDSYLTGVSQRFSLISSQNGFSKAQEVNFVASFIQTMPYKFDNVTTGFEEYARYPLETLVDNEGDCECKSILLAQLLTLMGYDVVLIDLPSHVSVGVYIPNGSGTYYMYDGVKYLYLESTSTGWTIGSIPDHYNGVSATIRPLKPIEILSLSNKWERTGNTFKVDVTIGNTGTADAIDYKVAVSFDAGSNLVWSTTSSNSFNVASESSKKITITLSAPTGKNTRLVIDLLDKNGYSVEKVYSTSFTT